MADEAFQTALDFGGLRYPKPQGEVAACKSICFDGFEDLISAWEPTLKHHRVNVQLHSVFLHQSPYVSWPNPMGLKPNRCELADLMIVCDFHNQGSAPERRAVLIQAKIEKSKRPGVDATQYELISAWPPFSLPRGYDARERDFRDRPSGDLNLSSEYGWILLRCNQRYWKNTLTEPGDQRFHCEEDLGPFVTRMMWGDAGFGAVCEINGGDDFSFTVDELLRVSATKRVKQLDPRSRAATWEARLAGGGDVQRGKYAGTLAEGPQGISTIHVTMRVIDREG
ncbi:MAG: hypothetical protein AAGP08_00345 [Pseudomonadota bacterium]